MCVSCNGHVHRHSVVYMVMGIVALLHVENGIVALHSAHLEQSLPNL